MSLTKSASIGRLIAVPALLTALLLAALTLPVSVPVNAEDSAQDNARHAVTSLKAYAAYKAGNYQEAQKIWQGLADKGNTTAMINLANMFQQGQGVTEDQRHALTYVEKAAQLGDKRAQYELGMTYESGIILNRDIGKAALWLEKSAGNGSPDGQFSYGVLLATVPDKDSNEVSETSKKRALYWLKEAHKNGNLEARDYIGVLEQSLKRF